MNNTKNITSSNTLKYLAFLIPLTPTILFILAHISAYMYYTHFGVDYFKYTDPSTAFNFALESMSIVFSISIAITVFLFIPLSLYFSAKHSDKTLILNLAAIFLGLTFVWFYTDVQEPFNYRDTINNKEYVPYKVSINNGEQELLCVISIGTIGEFRAFMTEKFQPILIPKNQITYIKPLFLPVPVKQITTGKKTLINPEYDEEMEVWLNKWKDTCNTEQSTQNQFEIFDFNKANIRNEWTHK